MRICLKRFDETKYLNIITGRFFFHNTMDLFEYLNKANIEYAVIKGEALSVQAYNANGVRSYSDLDILVSKDDINIVSSFLRQNGYYNSINETILNDPLKCRAAEIFYLSTSHQYFTFKKMIREHTLEIDLNFDVFWGEYDGRRLDVRSCFLKDAVFMDLYNCKVKCLNPIKAFIQLALHNYKDMNSIYILSKGNVSYESHMKDLFYLLINNIRLIPVDQLYDLSNSLEIIPYIYYMLHFMSCYYHDSLLEPYIKKFKTDDGELLLNCYGLNKKERRQWDITIEQRLNRDYVAHYIKHNLSSEELKKIDINKQYFG